MDDERIPEYDPESVGYPDVIDPDSTAFDEDESVREADGPETPLSPYATPSALDRYGTTPEEAREGTPLDLRLRAEVPDVGADDPADDDVEWSNRRGDVADDEVEEDEPPPIDDGEPDDVGRLEADGAEDPLTGRDEGFAGGGMSAEESAMHRDDEG